MAAVGVVMAAILLAVFVVGAIELAGAQASQRNEIKTEVRDRAVLTASLIDSLFNTIQGDVSTYEAEYGGTLTTAGITRTVAQSDLFIAVTDSSGTVLAASSGFDRSGVFVSSAQLAALAAGDQPYLLSNLGMYKGGLAIDLVVPFPAQSGGRRVLVTGVGVAALGAFFNSELADVPGVHSEVNYLLDGNDRILGASAPGQPEGSVPPGLAAGHPVTTGQHGSDYREAVGLTGSDWRVVLVAPAAQLFSSVQGAHEVVPWVIFAALVLAALIAMYLGLKALRSAAEVRYANARLALVNEDLRDANLALERRAAELARSNEELDSFASIASHDLQEPLRKVRTFNEQLAVLEADHLTDKGRDYLARSNAAAERMQRLIEDLLRFSRVSTQGRPFVAVDLAGVAADVVNDLERQIEETGARVSVGHLPTVNADPLQMHQLLQNLVSNALKFRREGVTPEVQVTAQVAGGDLQLVVADNGIGFEPRYAARIFRIFERLNGRTAYPGTGIGLALCRKIADRHGGSIEAIGRPGEGATFVVTLPLHHPEGSFGFGATGDPADHLEPERVHA